jgi:hypothetical protein
LFQSLGMEAIQFWEGWGVSHLELLQWHMVLIEGFQACDVAERQRNPAMGMNLPEVDGGTRPDPWQALGIAVILWDDHKSIRNFECDIFIRIP